MLNPISIANRLQGIGEYYFSKKLQQIEALNKQGKQVINLGIGSPDLPPHSSVIKALNDNAVMPNNHAYQSYKGIAPFREAIANWYATWYGVNLNPSTEVLPLIGSKEGIMHVCMSLLDANDVALIPNPGYPTYSAAVKLSGAKPVYYALTESNAYQPNFLELENLVKEHKVKLLFLNYPHMPTGATATTETYQKFIAFALQHNIILIHDNPYSFILNEKPESILSYTDALKCCIELNSLSKSHNMAGWRIGMLCAKAELIQTILTFKSNMDSGMFFPLQMAAIKALSLEKDWHNELNLVYAKRRDIAYEILNQLQCSFSTSQVGMFVWAKVNAPFLTTNNELGSGGSLSDEILENANVFITPGGIFGSNGNDFIRLSLCSKEDVLLQALQRIKAIKN